MSPQEQEPASIPAVLIIPLVPEEIYCLGCQCQGLYQCQLKSQDLW